MNNYKQIKMLFIYFSVERVEQDVTLISASSSIHENPLEYIRESWGKVYLWKQFCVNNQHLTEQTDIDHRTLLKHIKNGFGHLI